MGNLDEKVINFLMEEFKLSEKDVYNISQEEWEKIRERCFIIESNYDQELDDNRLYCAGIIVSTLYKELHE